MGYQNTADLVEEMNKEHELMRSKFGLSGSLMLTCIRQCQQIDGKKIDLKTLTEMFNFAESNRLL